RAMARDGLCWRGGNLCLRLPAHRPRAGADARAAGGGDALRRGDGVVFDRHPGGGDRLHRRARGQPPLSLPVGVRRRSLAQHRVPRHARGGLHFRASAGADDDLSGAGAARQADAADRGRGARRHPALRGGRARDLDLLHPALYVSELLAAAVKEVLPIDAALPEVLEALERRSIVVLEAPPGAGKTTRVPPALLDRVQGEIVVLEPRRLAARMAARRVALELADPDLVGWQVRFEQSGSPRTRLWYVTEGILARRILADPTLRGVGAVVLDEFHERHLPGDLALALARRLLPRIKLIVMSATLEATSLAEHLEAEVVRSEGRRFPVEIEHLEMADDRRLPQQVGAAVRRLTTPGTAGDVLVFLPGAAEIRQASEACAELAQHRDLLLTPLYGDLPATEQDRAVTPASRRKVILSTNAAETSITVPGVTSVVDSGLARIASHSPWSGLPALAVARISRASAAQRAGRAGRLGPGRALRLYTRHDFDSRPEHHPPEIERLDLAGTVLELCACGLEPESLPWLDPPPPAAPELAKELLRRIGALDTRGQATDLGRACARLPLHPRLARLAVEAASRGYRRDGCTAAAMLNEREARRSATPAPTGPSDVLDLLDQRRSAHIEQARAQLLRLAPPDGPAASSRDEAIRISVLAGFPDRVAKRRGEEVLLASGGAAQLAPESAVREADLLVAVDAEERRTR